MQKLESFGAPRHEGETIEVYLPRRSIYVMSGRARFHGVGNWKHGVKPLEHAAEMSGVPPWNQQAERRALVFRPSKAWTLWTLETGCSAALGSAVRATS